MTLAEFKESAEKIAAQYGLDKHAVTVIAGYYGHYASSNIYYTAQVWDREKSKHINSELQKNPDTALEAFKDNLEHYFKQYDQTVKDIQL